MPSQVFTVTEGQELNQPIGFQAFSVTIDNLTQSWAYVSATSTFIPPYQYGVVVNIPGADSGDIQWRTPSSIPVGPVGVGTLTATFTDARLTPSRGVSVYTQQTQVVLGSVASGTNANFKLPGGCQGLLVLVDSTSGVDLVGLLVLGLTSGALYYANTVGPGIITAGQPPLQNPAAFPVAPSVDPVVNIANNVVNGTPTITVIALFTSQVEPVTAVSLRGVIPGTLNPVPILGAARYLPVLQRPTFDVYAAQVTIAIAGTALIAAPGVGKELVIRRINVSVAAASVAANEVRFLTTGGTLFGVYEFAAGTAASPNQQSPPPLVYDDFALGDNLGISAFATAALGANITITYSIVTTANWPTG